MSDSHEKLSIPPARFLNIYAHGFLRVSVGSPPVRLADPDANARQALAMLREAHEQGSGLLVLPELALSAYALDDLLRQQALLDRVRDALLCLTKAAAALRPLCLVGAPLAVQGALYNCAVLIHRGRILGIVPKRYLPNYAEYYEARQFASAPVAPGATPGCLAFGGQTVPFGADLLFESEDLPGFTLHVELCEDAWLPVAPSALAALNGATVLANLSASTASIGKSPQRRRLCAVHSERCAAAYLYAAAGPGESTTDLAWDGDATIHELGTCLARGTPFPESGQLLHADIDLLAIRQARLRWGNFHQCAALHTPQHPFRRVAFRLAPVRGEDLGLRRTVPRFPFLPMDETAMNDLCEEACAIQAQGLTQRLRASGIARVVIGVSGGVDSTQALLIAVRAMDALALSRKNVLAFSLPAFATSCESRAIAHDLMKALGVQGGEIDLHAQCAQMLADIGHEAARGKAVFDTVYENVQAGARTATLFRLANRHHALVLGTGDLSELALGWATYGVGDHMSHYNVNLSAPKTLVQHLIRWQASRKDCPKALRAILLKVVARAISPELVPPDTRGGQGAIQETEAVVGPFALQDFNLYHATRHGFAPSRIAFLAWHAWGDRTVGRWPAFLEQSAQRDYGFGEILHWLRVFVRRFYETSQFKRSASPNGPRLTEGGALSPRGDWRAPSDVSADLWLRELDAALAEAQG